MKLTYKEVEKAYANCGYSFYKGPLNVNLFGIRSNSLLVNEWNDRLGVAYEDQFGNPVLLLHGGSTKPGLYYLKNKLGNPNGTAILAPGHYKSAWKIGEHKGYLALQQNRNDVFKVWRDNDADGQFTYSGQLYGDVGGLNMHTESLLNDTEKVGAYSAGCQVRQFDKEHFMVMNLLELAASRYGNSFSYTLFTDRDFIDL